MLPRSHGYTAGIFDGEGCISIAKYSQKCERHNKTYHYEVVQLAVSIFQTDERLMKWLAHHYGGTYVPRRPKPGRKQGWSWSPTKGKNLERFLLAIIPHLVVKKKQALLALQYIRLGNKKPGPGSNGLDENIQKKRMILATRCSMLNNLESPEANTSNNSFSS
jgi:hypothetical protein